MNKYIEAFDTIECRCHTDDEICNCNKATKDKICLECDVDKDLQTLRELVDKATPKKKEIADKEAFLSYYECPVCHSVVRPIDKYCSSCGQRIDTIVGDEDEYGKK